MDVLALHFGGETFLRAPTKSSRRLEISRLGDGYVTASTAKEMALNQPVKTTFEPKRVIQPIYTGGSVALSEDGQILATCLGDECLLSNLDTGEWLARIEGVSAVYGRCNLRD